MIRRGIDLDQCESAIVRVDDLPGYAQGTMPDEKAQ
jgi:hypothetical protein